MKDNLLKVSSIAVFSVLNSFRRLSAGEKIWLARQENVLIVPVSGAARFVLAGDWETVWDNTSRRINEFGEEEVVDGWKAVTPGGEFWSVDYGSGLSETTLTACGGARTRAGHLGVCRVSGSLPLASWFLVQLLAAEKAAPVQTFHNGWAALKGSRVGNLRMALRGSLMAEVMVIQKHVALANQGSWNWKKSADAERSMEEVKELIAVPNGTLKGYKWNQELNLIRQGVSSAQLVRSAA